MSVGKTFEGTDYNPAADTPLEEPVAPQQEETTSEESPPLNPEELKQELEVWQNRYKNAEKLIGKHSQELNELRQLKQQLEEQTRKMEESPEQQSKFLDDFVKDPKKALSAELARREAEQLATQRQQQQFFNQNNEYVYQAIPNFDELKHTIIELAKTDGIEGANMQMLEDTVRTDPLLAVQYAQRAKLQLELERVRNQGKATIQQIAKNSKKTPTLNGSSSQSNSRDSMSVSDIRNMSTAEIEKRLREIGFM